MSVSWRAAYARNGRNRYLTNTLACRFDPVPWCSVGADLTFLSLEAEATWQGGNRKVVVERIENVRYFSSLLVNNGTTSRTMHLFPLCFEERVR